MAFVLRWINLIIIFAGFILALVGTFPLPLFKYDLNGLYDQRGSIDATLWSIQTMEIKVSTDAGGQVYTAEKNVSVRINYLNCSEQRSLFRAMQAFSIAGTVFGFYAFLICALMCFCSLKVKLPLFLFLMLAFISQLLLLIVGATVYTKDACKNRPNFFQSFKSFGYKIAVGYILQIIACVLYFITFIITPFTQDLWCGNC